MSSSCSQGAVGASAAALGDLSAALEAMGGDGAGSGNGNSSFSGGGGSAGDDNAANAASALNSENVLL